MRDFKVYKCMICGTTVEILNGNGNSLICCGQNMVELKANTTDAAVEKHVPAIQVVGRDVLVKVGDVEHPMDEDHYIEWVEVINGERVCRQFLNPGEEPAAEFNCAKPGTTMREYCNKHGLWKAGI